MEDINKDFKYVYFIENHNISEKVKIYFSKYYYPEADELLNIFQNVYEYTNNKFLYTIYRFKIYPSNILSKQKQNIKKKFDVKIKLENEKGCEFEKIITITNFGIDNFIYDFQFEKHQVLFLTFIPPDSFKFNHEQQFDIYVKYLRQTLKLKQNSKENKDLILSTQNLIIGKGKKYFFSFYLMILLECFTTNLIQRHLLVFKLDKIEGIGEIPDSKKRIIQNILKVFEIKPEKVLDSVTDVIYKEKYSIALFAIILYFNYNFAHDRITTELLLNKNNYIKYIYQALLNYSAFFKNLKLTNEQINNLINISKEGNDINIALGYCNTIPDKYLIISQNRKLIEKYNEKEKRMIIQMDYNEEEILLQLAIKQSEEEEKKRLEKEKEEQRQMQIAIYESQKEFNNLNSINIINEYEEFDEQYGICPITQDYMKNPVITPSGNYYEKFAIVEWINLHHTDPLTREKLTIDMILEDEEYRKKIIEYRKKYNK